ncbi:DUF2586 domain-containing protein [Pseudoalteromonas sp. S1691]|uniref:DUF2586 domain-containing protein n=1 Tax=Pseudoalteromonas sp. S1691 TaxID=579513 RepID=UPI002017EF42|nr:DUF2586 domain-containing protein [Pseudoalteromonas sp. S1691]
MGKPLRVMSNYINIGADKFPGLIDAPKDDSISLTFMNATTLQVVVKVYPID